MVVVKMSHFGTYRATMVLEHFDHVPVHEGDQVVTDFTGREAGFTTDMFVRFREDQEPEDAALAFGDFSHVRVPVLFEFDVAIGDQVPAVVVDEEPVEAVVPAACVAEVVAGIKLGGKNAEDQQSEV
jgi:hypothetical protein